MQTMITDLWCSTLNFSSISRNGLAVLNSELSGGITHDKLNVSTLAAISANLGSITAGTITSAKYQSSSSGSRIVINEGGWADTLIGYDASSNRRLGIDSAGIIEAYKLQPVGGSYPTCTLMNGVIGRFSPSGSTVYNGAAPTSWTDLNLSAYVGSRWALVLLQIENNGGSDTNYRFRMNGSSSEQYPNANDVGGVFGCKCDTTQEHNYVWCMTDSSGKIEWDADVASSTVVTLLAYIS